MHLFVEFVFIFIFLKERSQVYSEPLDTAPLVYVKSLLEEPLEVQLTTWQKLKDVHENSPQATNIQDAISDMVQSRSVLKVDEKDVKVLHLPKGINLSSYFSIPYPNILTLISTSFNILLDGLDTDILFKKLKDIELIDCVIPSNMKHNTVLELLSKVPQFNSNQIGLVNEMNVQGRVAFLIIRDILKKEVNNEWHDAFLALSLTNAIVTDQDSIEAPLGDLGSFVQSVIFNLSSVKALPSSKLPAVIRGNSYLFGWWLNCEKDQPCLIGMLPRDTIISFSPALRMYILPTLKTGFVIANTVQKSYNMRTMKDLLNFDAELFRRMLIQTVKKPEDNQEHTPSTTKSTSKLPLSVDQYDAMLELLFQTSKYYVVLYMDFMAGQHLIVRVIAWVIFLFIAHLVTAWIYHGIWWIVCKLVKRTHDPRPKKD